MPTTVVPYADNLEYLVDEFRRLDLLLRRQVLKLRATRRQETPAEFQGLYIAEAEVDEWLGGKGGKPSLRSEATGLADFTEALTTVTVELTARTAESLRQGLPLRLPHLAGVFGLNPIETDALLICLAHGLDPRYQKLYAYLQDDVTKKKPTVDLVLSILCSALGDKLGALELFARDASLRRYRLVSLSSEPSDPDVPLLAQFLTLDERLTDFLLGRDRLDARWEPFVYWASSERTVDDLVFPEALGTTLRQLCEAYRAPPGGGRLREWLLLFHGPHGVGKCAAAQALCRTAGLSLLVIDVPALIQCDAKPAETFAVLFREARLYGAAVYLEGWQTVVETDETGVRVRPLLHELAQFPGLVFIGGTVAWQPPEMLSGKTSVSVAFPAPGLTERLRLWQVYAAQLLGDATDHLDLLALATTFRFTGGRIVEALQAACHRALSRGQSDGLPTMEDLYHSCRAVSARRLGTFARPIPPKHSWEDLVLPGDAVAQLKELCGQVRHRLTVYDQWGFDGKLSLGKGLIALFSGPSGTGKTFAAEIIAGDLGMDLYQIDLSCVVSKYIGETEKNLSRVFQEAQDSNAILFFDEADALFGKRSEVKDAHDRYANIEINYLLQRVDEYEGVIILASNMSKQIDAAFLRRLHFSIEFPFPDEDHRLRIWRGIFPAQAPLACDVDFDFLAHKFKIAGGNIKNVALASAFHAAEDDGVIHMKHLVLALKREYQKLGKVCEKTEFEQYYELVRS